MAGPETLSELEKAMRRSPSTPPHVLIEALAEQLSIDGEVQPPVDLALLASLQSIGEIVRTGSTHAGCLINRDGTLRIEVRTTDSSGRQNFTIGHEICHTLLPGFTLTENFRCSPGQSRPSTRHGALDVETLADVGASELLLPRRFIRSAFLEEAFGWESVTRLADVYGASLEATARRFVHLSKEPALFVRFEFGTSASNSTPELRVKASASSAALPVFIPWNKSVPRAHPIARAAEGEYVDQAGSLDFLIKQRGEFLISAMPSPYTNHEGDTVMRVLVLAVNAASSVNGRTR